MADDPLTQFSSQPAGGQVTNTQVPTDPAAVVGQVTVAVSQTQPQPQPILQPQTGGPKEQVEMRPAGEHGVEKSADVVQEIPSNVELEKKPELDGFVQNAGEDMEIAGGVTDDYTQKVLMQQDKADDRVTVLPLSEQQVQEGLHHKVWESIRWLAEWCVRQAKMLHGKVMYRK